MSQKLKEQKNKQAVYYDRGAKRLDPLKKGDVVWVLPLPGQSKWFKVQVDGQAAVRSYKVCTEDGKLYHHNHSHLYKVPENYPPVPDCEVVQSKQTSLNQSSSQDHTEDPAGVSPAPHMPEVSATAGTSQLDIHKDPPDVPVPVTTRSGRIVKKTTLPEGF